jgi:CubicO group peptidase (beta-lactamase class C family)
MAEKGMTRRQFAVGVTASAALARSAIAQDRIGVPGSRSATTGIDGSQARPPLRRVRAIEIANWMASQNVLGLAACIAKGDRVVWRGGYGLANMTKGVPFTPDQTLFHIASISKTITATAVMQLRDRGLFDLDEDVGKFVTFPVRNPRYPEQPVTFKHLLTHTSSIDDSDALDSTYSVGDPVMSLAQVATRYFTSSGSLWSRRNYARSAPGAEVRYSNAGFALLGYLVELIANQPLEEYLQQNVYSVLRMNETSFYIAKLDSERHGRPYTYVGRLKGPLCPGDGDGNLLPEGVSPKAGYNEHALYSYPTLADGMIRTSVSQLANFMIAMMNRGRFGEGRLLKQETVAEMLGGWERGLGWLKSGSYWGHDGVDPGCSTEMLLDPKRKIGLIIFANADVDLKRIKAILVTEAEQGTV